MVVFEPKKVGLIKWLYSRYLKIEYVFRLRFVLANAISTYLRLKFVLCVERIFYVKGVLIEFVIPESDLLLYLKNL